MVAAPLGVFMGWVYHDSHMQGLNFDWRDWRTFSVLSVIFVVGARGFWFVCDDAYISFRYSRNLALGHGFRFNLADPPVEGFSNLLWVLIAAALEGLLISPVVWMPVLSCLAGLILLGRWWVVATQDLGCDRRSAGVAGLFVAASPIMLIWATSGLETMAFALAVFVLAEVAFLRTSNFASAMGLLSLLALVTLRPEGAGWAAVILVLAAWVRQQQGRSLRSGAWGCLALLLLMAALTGFRLWTFGDWMPNTARVKVGLGSWLLLRGLKYVALLMVSVPALMFALFGMGVFARRGAPWAAWAVLAAGFPIWAILMGGDFFPMGRMLVPMVPIVGLAVAAWLSSMKPVSGLAVGGGLVVLQLLACFDVMIVPESARQGLHFRHSDLHFMSEVARWNNMRDNTDAFVKRGRSFAVVWEPGTVFVTRAIGAVAYLGEVHVLDQYGLIDPNVARRDVLGHPSERSPGHDKEVDVAWFADLQPDLIYARHVSGEDGPAAMQRALKRWPVPHGLRSSYVPDFVEVDLEPELDEWLFVVRRVRDGESPAHSRRAFERRRKSLAQERNARHDSLTHASP